MDRRNTIVFVILLIILLIVLIVVMNMTFNPFMMRTQRGIHRQLLQLTPIGTSMEEVIYVFENNTHLTIQFVSEDMGIHDSLVRHFYPHAYPNLSEFIGEKYILAHTDTNVVIYCVFNEIGELIGIFVRKHINLL